jgi:hypothetical protein
VLLLLVLLLVVVFLLLVGIVDILAAVVFLKTRGRRRRTVTEVKLRVERERRDLLWKVQWVWKIKEGMPVVTVREDM